MRKKRYLYGGLGLALGILIGYLAGTYMPSEIASPQAPPVTAAPQPLSANLYYVSEPRAGDSHAAGTSTDLTIQHALTVEDMGRCSLILGEQNIPRPEQVQAHAQLDSGSGTSTVVEGPGMRDYSDFQLLRCVRTLDGLAAGESLADLRAEIYKGPSSK